MKTTTEFMTISISVNGAWAGSGKLVNGRITDCGAQFCEDADESEEVYGLIEAAIDECRDSLSVDTDDGQLSITWSIVTPS